MPVVNIGSNTAEQASSGGLDLMEMFEQFEAMLERVEDNPKLKEAIAGGKAPVPAEQPEPANLQQAPKPDSSEPEPDAQEPDALRSLLEEHFPDTTVNDVAEWVSENPDEVSEHLDGLANQAGDKTLSELLDWIAENPATLNVVLSQYV